MIARRSFLFIAALGFIAFFVQGATAADKDAPAAFVQKMGDQALSSLTGKDLSKAEREERVRKMLHNSFDVPTIARFALGLHWRSATQEEQKEYLTLFENMIVKTYAERFAEYEGQDFKVGSTIPAGKDFMVSSKILQDGGPPVVVDWRVRNKKGTLKVIDVLVEGISMSVTQRSDFSSVIQKGGGKVSALLDSLRKHQGIKKTSKS